MTSFREFSTIKIVVMKLISKAENSKDLSLLMNETKHFVGCSDEILKTVPKKLFPKDWMKQNAVRAKYKV